ncbi:DnaB-like helicase N-terminal domain-containing protein [Streptomyces noboritoensis]|uniref:DnaB-like helicase N-terminal domain-containing protein n=1 Tax=Streptomyces noboritoensis TaxID=67337 RepID=A0ABV6TG43_9ACTN
MTRPIHDDTAPTMPAAPEAPEDPALDPVVHYAEQALLGALLLAPERLKSIGLLEPDQFADAVHRVLFAAMQSIVPPPPEVHRTSPVWLNGLLDAARPTAPALTASYLHTLIQACPRDAHAAAYAQMVRAGHARRTLHHHATLLAQAATTPGPDPAAAVLARADTLAAHLDELATVFPAHPGPVPRAPAPEPARPDVSDEALHDEWMLLAALTAHPETLKRMRWLYEADFTHPRHAALFAALTALTRRGTPVDPITVLGEAQHRHLLHDGFGPKQVLALAASPAGTPEHWGHKVLRRALLTQARTTAHQIRSLAQDEATTIHQLTTGSRRALAALSAVRARWHHATTTPPRARAPATLATKPPARPATRART